MPRERASLDVNRPSCSSARANNSSILVLGMNRVCGARRCMSISFHYGTILTPYLIARMNRIVRGATTMVYATSHVLHRDLLPFRLYSCRFIIDQQNIGRQLFAESCCLPRTRTENRRKARQHPLRRSNHCPFRQLTYPETHGLWGCSPRQLAHNTLRNNDISVEKRQEVNLHNDDHATQRTGLGDSDH